MKLHDKDYRTMYMREYPHLYYNMVMRCHTDRLHLLGWYNELLDEVWRLEDKLPCSYRPIELIDIIKMHKELLRELDRRINPPKLRIDLYHIWEVN